IPFCRERVYGTARIERAALCSSRRGPIASARERHRAEVRIGRWDGCSRLASGKGVKMKRVSVSRSELRRIIQSRLRSHLGCRDADIVIRQGSDEDDWTAELDGLPMPDRCRKALGEIVAEIRRTHGLAPETKQP